MILFLLVLYFIWKYYTELAIKYKKNKWGYFLVGVASYFGGSLILGLILGVIVGLTDSNFLEETDEKLLGIISFPINLGSVWSVYQILKKRWEKGRLNSDNDSLDSDLIRTDTGD